VRKEGLSHGIRLNETDETCLIHDSGGNRFAVICDGDRGPTILGGTRDIPKLLWRDSQSKKSRKTDEKWERLTAAFNATTWVLEKERMRG